ncbi:MAG TPA: hypothetical protein VG796_23315 [Verrucomicrobiales bacterium]|nr:hypothetical protein [Verrucomicrobiales bacterium]
MLEKFFGEEPLYIPVSSGAGGIEAAMNAILVALGKRKGADVGAAQKEVYEVQVLEGCGTGSGGAVVEVSAGSEG